MSVGSFPLILGLYRTSLVSYRGPKSSTVFELISPRNSPRKLNCELTCLFWRGFRRSIDVDAATSHIRCLHKLSFFSLESRRVFALVPVDVADGGEDTQLDVRI